MKTWTSIVAMLFAIHAYAQYEVTNTNDSGAGSLREAITNANGNAGTNNITFNIPNTDPNYSLDGGTGNETWTIYPVTDLPEITEGVVLDATTQPGSGNYKIKIDGQGTRSRGFWVNSGFAEVYGFYLTGFNANSSSAGVYILHLGGSPSTIGGVGKGNVINSCRNGISISLRTSCIIQGNLIGTDETGEIDLGNTVGIQLATSASSQIVGGDLAGEGNLISGNTTGITANASGGHSVRGNYIGTNIDGTTAIPNGAGISFATSNNNSFVNNLISGNSGSAIRLGFSTNNTIQGNIIGEGSDGSVLGNDRGIEAFNTQGVSNNIIGGILPAEGNTIVNNTNEAILFINSNSVNNSIIGNSIHCNGAGINLSGVANNNIQPPVINEVTSTTVGGEGIDGDEVHVYRDNSGCTPSAGQGQEYLGTATVSGGVWQLSGLSIAIGTDLITATATNGTDGTSEFVGQDSYIVTNITDAGIGSLRWAIINANASTDPSVTISFNIGSSAPWIVQPASALPTVNNVGAVPIIIDATTQPGWAFGDPNAMIHIEGSLAGGSSVALIVQEANVEIYGLVIEGFFHGIRINTGADGLIIGAPGKGNVIKGLTGWGIISGGVAGNVTIQSNYIGTSVDGLSMDANSGAGIGVEGDNILIGGNSTLGEGNVISNNGSGGFEYGIYTGTGDNIEIYGNLIGTDKNGENDFGNLRGIWVLNGASNVTIGGTGTGQRNVISGTFSAFSVHLQSVDNVIVDNNFIGLNSAGTTAIPNTRNGIDIDASGSGAIIRNNTIAASTEDGIYMESETADVIIENNMIGTTPTGVAGTGLGNRNGIVFNSSGGIDNTTQRIRISGNVISGNSADGINFNSTCSNFILTDNLIGVESDGTTPLGNAGSGIELSSTTTNIEIGGTSQENSIANNTLAGIRFEGLAQEPSGTIIGVNSYFCNSTDAIDFTLTPTIDAPVITTISSGSIDGTSTEPDGTLIDVYETDLSCMDNQGATYLGQTTVTSGNWSLSGSFTMSNSFVATATDPTIGISEFSPAVSANLYIVTNTNDSGAGSLREAITNANASTGETISFNIPGSGPWDITLLSNLPNLLSTMTIDGTTQPGSTSTNLIGIRATAACDRGLAIVTNDCEIYGLEITGFNGSGDFGGIYMGLSVTSGQIGAALKGNVLSNNRYGLQIEGDNVVVQGNKFGTDNTGSFANGNTETGIYIINGDGNTIGGAGANEGNLISGNSQLGIRMANSDNNTVQGNIIGMNAAGLSRVSNGISGIGIGGGTTFTSNGNTIGGAGANEGNLISGNSVYGITLSYGSNNLILGNKIGLDSNGDQFNFTPFGILIGGAFGEVATDNTVGGIGPGEANSIAGHSSRGVWLQVNTGTSERNTIRGNAIYCNGELGITLNAGTNNDISAPIITDFTAGIGTATVTGECPTCTTGDLIDVYRDNSACADGQGQEYLGTVTFGTDPWTLGGLTLSSDDLLTVMVTDISGNSSEFGPAAPEIVVYEGAGTAGTEITDAQVTVVDLGSSDQGVDLTFDVTIENAGSALLTIASITSSATEYSFVATPTTLNAGENATFTIQLDATDVGTFPSTITINSDDQDENPFTFSVTGEITGPEIELYVGTDNTGTLLSDAQSIAIDFGSVLVGTDLVLDFAIENTGTAVLNISSIGSSASEYSVTGAPSAVAIGATATFSITLDGSSSGIFNSTITISSDDADENPFTFPVTGEIIAPEPEIEVYVGQLHPSTILSDGQLTEVDLGKEVNGNSITVLFYIENTGAAALNISNITSDQTEFSIVGAPTSVAAGGSETFDIVLDGSVTGIFNATITITSDDLDESPFTFPVMGQITEPEIEVYFGNNNTGAPITNGQASEVDIGASDLGNNLSETFAIENLGTSLLSISSITSINPDFTITSAPTSVGEGATEIFFIELDASVAGSFTTTITIVSDDLDEGTFTFPVTGSIVESLDILFYYEDSPLISGSTVDFGLTKVGEPLTLAFTIENPSASQVLTFTTLAIANSEFSLVNPPTSINVGESESFDVVLAASRRGVYNGTLTIDSNFEPFMIQLTGEVTPRNNSIHVFNVVTPNGDGVHDFLRIQRIDEHPNNTVSIFNRVGKLLYEASGYNNEDVRFDGKGSDGKTLQSGTYYYVIELGGSEREAGFIQIITN